MEQKDLDLEARVWKRIGGAASASMEKKELLADNGHILELLRCSEEASVVYRYLTAHSTGIKREKLSLLTRKEMNHCAALRGMAIMDGGEPSHSTDYEPHPEPYNRILAKAYRSSCRLYHRYLQLTHNDNFGCIFNNLSEEESGTMQTLLELIGS